MRDFDFSFESNLRFRAAPGGQRIAANEAPIHEWRKSHFEVLVNSNVVLRIGVDDKFPSVFIVILFGISFAQMRVEELELVKGTRFLYKRKRRGKRIVWGEGKSHIIRCISKWNESN